MAYLGAWASLIVQGNVLAVKVWPGPRAGRRGCRAQLPSHVAVHPVALVRRCATQPVYTGRAPRPEAPLPPRVRCSCPTSTSRQQSSGVTPRLSWTPAGPWSWQGCAEPQQSAPLPALPPPACADIAAAPQALETQLQRAAGVEPDGKLDGNLSKADLSKAEEIAEEGQDAKSTVSQGSPTPPPLPAAPAAAAAGPGLVVRLSYRISPYSPGDPFMYERDGALMEVPITPLPHHMHSYAHGGECSLARLTGLRARAARRAKQCSPASGRSAAMSFCSKLTSVRCMLAQASWAWPAA